MKTSINVEKGEFVAVQIMDRFGYLRTVTKIGKKVSEIRIIRSRKRSSMTDGEMLEKGY